MAKKITKLALAKRWGVTSGALSQGAYKLMPKFESFEDADRWRSENIGQARVRPAEPELPAVQSEPSPSSQAPRDTARNFEVFLQQYKGREHESIMLEHAERVPLMAYAVYESAVAEENPIKIDRALKNWSEASKQGRICRKEWYTMQQLTRLLLHMDDVRNEVGAVLAELRRKLDTLGDLCAADANPADPELAKSVINSEVDKIYKSMDEALPRIEQELMEGELQAEANMDDE